MQMGSKIRRKFYIAALLTVLTVVFCLTFLSRESGGKVHVKIEVVTSPNGLVTSLLNKSSQIVVPNIVHYVWFGADLKFRFHHFLSLKSAFKMIKPNKIMFHHDNQPIGKWWKRAKKEIPILSLIKRQPPLQIFGNKIVKSEHKSDVARMAILKEYGGIYLDTDVIALKSFDPLRRYQYTMGIEYHGNPGRLNNGVIISAPNATFLTLWNSTYRNFTKREWDYHDSVIPYNLQFEHPKLIHVEEKTLNYPSGKEIDLIYKKTFDWSRNYAMHLWYRLYDTEHGPTGIRTLNNTFGQIARYIYYGSKDRR